MQQAQGVDRMDDLRARTVACSFVVLLAVLGFSAFASSNHAQPNTALTEALFGPAD
ncbi:MAG: hypothetical protein RIQ46_1892 [Pseudomonadota bacterium]|jgi:hypothetical protein